jgi:uncharacterized lipoprotein NlpE involved in copper resistance
MRTRTLPLLLCGALLASCGSDTPSVESADVPTTDSTTSPAIQAEWSGYYDGTLPSIGRPDIAMQLWVRNDSTFVLRQRYNDMDSMAFGTIGKWHVVNGLMTIDTGTDKSDFWKYTGNGIEEVDEMGEASKTSLNNRLEKHAGELHDEIPRMRLSGTFTYMADAMSFQPCGTSINWPCAGGEQWTDEGEKGGSLNTLELERHYARSVKQGGEPWTISVECSMNMGPAMEGDGADEYIFIHRVLKETACP